MAGSTTLPEIYLQRMALKCAAEVLRNAMDNNEHGGNNLEDHLPMDFVLNHTGQQWDDMLERFDREFEKVIDRLNAEAPDVSSLSL